MENWIANIWESFSCQFLRSAQAKKNKVINWHWKTLNYLCEFEFQILPPSKKTKLFWALNLGMCFAMRVAWSNVSPHPFLGLLMGILGQIETHKLISSSKLLKHEFLLHWQLVCLDLLKFTLFGKLTCMLEKFRTKEKWSHHWTTSICWPPRRLLCNVWTKKNCIHI